MSAINENGLIVWATVNRVNGFPKRFQAVRYCYLNYVLHIHVYMRSIQFRIIFNVDGIYFGHLSCSQVWGYVLSKRSFEHFLFEIQKETLNVVTFAMKFVIFGELPWLLLRLLLQLSLAHSLLTDRWREYTIDAGEPRQRQTSSSSAQ